MESQSELNKLSSFNCTFVKLQEHQLNKNSPPRPRGANSSTVVNDREYDEERGAAPAKTRVILALPALVGLAAPLVPIAVDWGIKAVIFLLPLLLDAIGSVVKDMINDKVKPKNDQTSETIHPSHNQPSQNNPDGYYVVINPSTGQYMWLPKEQFTRPWNPIGQFAIPQNPGGQYPTPQNPGEQFSPQNPGGLYSNPENNRGQFPTLQNSWGQYPLQKGGYNFNPQPI